MKSVYHLFFTAVLLAACSSAPSGNAIQTAIVQTEMARPTKTFVFILTAIPTPLPPTLPPKPTATTSPTATQKPTIGPSPTYSEPVVLLEISGTGATITDNYQLPKCRKAVFYWNVSPNSNGTASLILNLYKTTVSDSVTLVNDIAMNVPGEGLGGSINQSLKGGEYYFSTENTDEAWTVRLECQDGVAPVGTSMNIQATGMFVSDNYELPKCNKSIFNWSVEPNSNGTASLILYLCSLTECNTLVNEIKMDLSSALTGQALQPLSGGVYFIGSENTQQPWSVTWECKD
jgi:hypothetical protein